MTDQFSIGQLLADNYPSAPNNLRWTYHKTTDFHSTDHFVPADNSLPCRHGRLTRTYTVDLKQKDNLPTRKKKIFYFLPAQASTFAKPHELPHNPSFAKKLAPTVQYKTCNFEPDLISS